MRKTTRFLLVAALLAAGLLTASRAEGAVQALNTGDALRDAVLASDGVVRFEFAARPGVWGNGHNWNFTSRDDESSIRRSGCRGCTNGPVRVTIDVRRGVVHRLESQVGGDWPETGRDLGEVDPGAAADYLLALAEGGVEEESAEEAMQAAVASEAAVGDEIWPRLIGIARDRSRGEDLRSAALFWAANEAGQRAAADIEQIAIASDDETDVQEAAVFALTQLPDGGTDALLRLARENRNPRIVQSVYFWLGQSDDPRAIQLFEDVLLD
ncbi:MAG: HEAT repeat domain-containing protein [Gemmatimonadales bacterium]|jgi:hypothetical protein